MIAAGLALTAGLIGFAATSYSGGSEQQKAAATCEQKCDPSSCDIAACDPADCERICCPSSCEPAK